MTDARLDTNSFGLSRDDLGRIVQLARIKWVGKAITTNLAYDALDEDKKEPNRLIGEAVAKAIEELQPAGLVVEIDRVTRKISVKIFDDINDATLYQADQPDDRILVTDECEWTLYPPPSPA